MRRTVFRVKVYKVRYGRYQGLWAWECSHFPFAATYKVSWKEAFQAACTHLKAHRGYETVQLPK